MTNPKHPPPQFNYQQTPNPSESDSLEGIRYAKTPAGLLATRSEDTLRRYVLDAVDETDHAARQTSLLREASISLAQLPITATASCPGKARPNFVEMGLFAWPVVISMERPLLVNNCLDLNGRHQEYMAHALAGAFIAAMRPGLCYARVDGFVNAQLLCGLSPLAIHSALRAEARSPTSQPQQANSVKSIENKLGYPAHQSVNSPVGPNLPVAFLLIGYLAWDFAQEQPSLKASLAPAKNRLHSLCNAFFTHKMVYPAGTKTEGIELAKPTVRLGEPQLLHDAATQAQWMQLAWLAERARQGGFSHGFNIETLGSYLTLSASLTDEDEEVRASINYSYDGFWQTDGQLASIDQRVSLAQATGRMDCVDLEFIKKH